MNRYVFCNKKSSKPRMNVRVCQAKCPDKEDCPDLAEVLATEEVDCLPVQEIMPAESSMTV